MGQGGRTCRHDVWLECVRFGSIVDVSEETVLLFPALCCVGRAIAGRYRRILRHITVTQVQFITIKYFKI